MFISENPKSHCNCKAILSRIIVTLYAHGNCMKAISYTKMSMLAWMMSHFILTRINITASKKPHKDLSDTHTLLLFLIKTVRKQCCSQVLS